LYDATDNEVAARTTRTASLYAGGILGLSLNGSTIPANKVALWDGGIALATHQEFVDNRIVIKDTVPAKSHATHVAGTIAAAGVYSAARGMAYGLPNLLSFNFDNDQSEMSANAANLLLSNHSYGNVSGWEKNEDKDNRWEFRGRWNENEDYKFGYYDSRAKAWDEICYNAPYYLPVKSAGNNRNVNGPAVGEPYYRYNSSGVMASAGNRPEGISSNDGYGIIATYGNAKNILTVGAVNGLRYGSQSPADIVMSSFSSWGPTDDGRIKPDIVADGVGVISTTNVSNTSYGSSSGTSMATPNVTGSLVLLQELYNQQNSTYMRSATLKALAIATADEAGGTPGPDYKFGWGLLNAEAAAKTILSNGGKSVISERTLAQGETQTINVIASGNGPLIATVCWTDPAAEPILAANALNNTTPRLINDLDIRLSDGSTTFSPWILNPAAPSSAATTGDNFRDNVEQIYIADARPGKSYTITVAHKNTLTNGSQAFSIILTGVGGSAYCTSAPSASEDSKITNFTLSNINNTPAAGCTTYSDCTSQTVELERAKSYTLSLTLGTCGADRNKVAKVFADWNGDGDFDDAGENIATSSVISGTGSYSQTITVPETVGVGNYAILRVVMVETSSVNDVSACGSYSKGETQDYKIKFLEAAINVGVLEVVSPNASEDKAGLARKVAIKIKNYGTSDVSNIPVTATIKDGNTVIKTISANLNGTIKAAAEATFLLQDTFDAQQAKTYTITAGTNLSGDMLAGDNQANKTVVFSEPPSINNVRAFYTDNAGTNFLYSTQSDGTLF
jgi:hypothetical protein